MSAERQTIVIGCDHAGFALKVRVKSELAAFGLATRDVGTLLADEPSDYPGYAAKVAESVSSGTFERGILVCGTGMGTSIVANRFPRVRAVVCTNVAMAKTARTKLDCNVLVLGGDYTHNLEVVEILRAFLNTKFEGGRHARRIRLIDDTLQLSIALGHLEQVNMRKVNKDNVNEHFFSRAAKGFEKIVKSFATTERRDGRSRRQPESCPTTFTLDGEKFKALMVDMSQSGAQLQISLAGKQPRFIRDDILALSVKTPYGASSCSGSVRWFDRESGHLGISFAEFPADEDDPLRLLVDGMM